MTAAFKAGDITVSRVNRPFETYVIGRLEPNDDGPGLRFRYVDPLRIVMPDEAHRARWIRQLTCYGWFASEPECCCVRPGFPALSRSEYPGARHNDLGRFATFQQLRRIDFAR